MIDPKRLKEKDLQREVITPSALVAKIQDWLPERGLIRVMRDGKTSHWMFCEDLDFARGTYQDGGTE